MDFFASLDRARALQHGGSIESLRDARQQVELYAPLARSLGPNFYHSVALTIGEAYLAEGDPMRGLHWLVRACNTVERSRLMERSIEAASAITGEPQSYYRGKYQC